MTLTQAEIDEVLTPLYVCLGRILTRIHARAVAEGWEDDFRAGKLHPAPQPTRRPTTQSRKAS